MERADLAVIGLGPAGATLALEAARRGLHVVGYDVSRRYAKACGNATPRGHAAARLAEYVGAIVCEVNSFRILVDGEESVSIASRSPLWVILDKESFVGGIREMAESEGATLEYGAPHPPRDALIVDARGPYASGYSMIVYRVIARTEWPAGEALIDFRVGDAGLYWVFPSGNGAVNAGAGFLGTRDPRVLRDHVRSYLDRILPRYDIVDERAAPLASMRPPRLYDSHRIYVGEAAGLVNALSGEGIRQAVLSSYHLAEALHSCDLHPDCSRKRYRTYARTLELEASVSKRLLAAVIRAAPTRSRSVLTSLGESFWREFLAGHMFKGIARASMRPHALYSVVSMLASAALRGARAQRSSPT